MANKTNRPKDETPHAKPDKAFSQQLRVQLTDKEITALARDLADTQNKQDQEHENKKRGLAELNARLKALSAESSRLAIMVTSGYTFKEVECAQYFDWPKKGRKSTFRLDTEECLTEEEMTQADRQLSLPIERPQDQVDPEEETHVIEQDGSVITMDEFTEQLKNEVKY